ncbi:MAG: RNA degradosome polyphosphate kinase, partial [Clostridia bacterium]|nr:RNA degradosome polyphosphate kinase [Clostridia bacterium]
KANVPVRLIIRGICCLIPNIEKTSENIIVHSIVGQFLEHSRMFRFENGGEPQMYLGSADWMPRNLDRRVELVFPVEDEDIHKRCNDILELMWNDVVNTRIQLPDATYVMIDRRGKRHLNCQTEFAQLAKRELKQKKELSSNVKGNQSDENT